MQIARQVDAALVVKGRSALLIERGNRLADVLALDGALGDAEEVGDLSDGQVVEEPQCDDRPLPRGQQVERLAEVELLVPGRRRALRRRCPSPSPAACGAGSSRHSLTTLRGVGQPGLRPRAPPHDVQLGHPLLGQVLGEVPVVDDEVRRAPQPGRVGGEELGELLVACPHTRTSRSTTCHHSYVRGGPSGSHDRRGIRAGRTPRAATRRSHLAVGAARTPTSSREQATGLPRSACPVPSPGPTRSWPGSPARSGRRCCSRS